MVALPALPKMSMRGPIDEIISLESQLSEENGRMHLARCLPADQPNGSSNGIPLSRLPTVNHHPADESTHQIPSNGCLFSTFYHFPYTADPPTSTAPTRPFLTIVRTFSDHHAHLCLITTNYTSVRRQGLNSVLLSCEGLIKV